MARSLRSLRPHHSRIPPAQAFRPSWLRCERVTQRVITTGQPALATKAAERGVAVPDHEDYDTWRNVTDFAVGRCEGLMDDPVNYGIHLYYIALREESLGSALTRVRDVLEDDDRHLAATLAGQREGEDIQMRDERVARLLDDPEKLRELRQQRAERKAERQQQSKGRHWSMRI